MPQERIHTTTPDADAIERALLRISSTAAILERLADAEMQRGDRHLANALGQLAEDLALAHDTLAPLPGYLTRRAAA